MDKADITVNERRFRMDKADITVNELPRGRAIAVSS